MGGPTKKEAVLADDATKATEKTFDDPSLDGFRLLLCDDLTRKPERTLSFPESLSGFYTSWMNRSKDYDDEDLHLSPTEDDDDESVSYYQPTDFVPSHWLKAMDVPTFGFAVVSTAIVIVHPWLFLAGALTAFGMVHAAGAGYDYLAESTVFSNSSDGEEKSEETKLVTVLSEPVLRRPSVESLYQVLEGENEEEAEQEEQKQEQLLPLSSDAPELAELPPCPETLRLYFPPLQNEIVKDAELPGLNAQEFFHVFFDNDAPYTFLEFQKHRGDIDIHYGTWKALEPIPPLSIHPAAVVRPIELHHESLLERVLSFKTKTNSYFAPPYAAATKTQRVLIASKKLVLIESKTQLADIPFCDRFEVIERWHVSAEKRGDRYISLLTVYSEVVFFKKCPFEPQIRTNSCKTVHDIVAAWCSMAREALKLTEQAKRNRIQKELEAQNSSSSLAETTSSGNSSSVDEDDFCEEESIEVMHSPLEPSRSWILCDEDPRRWGRPHRRWGKRRFRNLGKTLQQFIGKRQ